MSLPWFRMYHEFCGDAVIQALAFEDQRHYVMVLCFKASGLLDRPMPSVDVRHALICKALGLDVLAGSEARRRLSAFGLVGDDWQPAAWDKRQYKSDDVTARTRKFRARQEEEINKSILDTDTDTEQNVPPNVPGTFPKKKTAGRLPEDFGLTDERTAYAKAKLPRVDTQALMEAFCDHWKNKLGKDGLKLDWDATWRTWVRNANSFGYPMVPAPTNGNGKREPTVDEISAARRVAAEQNQRQLQRALGGAVLKGMP